MEKLVPTLRDLISDINDNQGRLEQHLGLSKEPVEWEIDSKERTAPEDQKVFFSRYRANRQIRAKLLSAIGDALQAEIPFTNPN